MTHRDETPSDDTRRDGAHRYDRYRNMTHRDGTPSDDTHRDGATVMADTVI